MNDAVVEVATATLPWQFGVDMADIRRELERAPLEDRAKRFAERAAEGIRWHTVKNLPKAEVVDRLSEIGAAIGLHADVTQAALSEAIEHPFDPAPRMAYRAANDVEQPRAEPLRALTLDELLALDVEPRAQLLSPVIPEKGLAMLYAPRGIGKTYLALSMTYALATGTGLLRWQAPRPIRCLYIDGEMPMAALKERTASIVAADQSASLDPANFKMLAADYHPNGLPNLDTAEGQAAIEPLLEGVEFIALDNLSTLVPAARDNDADSWTRMQGWLLQQRRQGRAVLMCHHAGKGGQQRGTSRREDVLDTVIALRHPSDYTAEEGARFEVHIEKARGCFGDDVKSFEAKMETINGGASWSMRDLADVNKARVIELLTEGLSIRDAAEEAGMRRSTVHRLKKAAEAEGHVFPKAAK